MPCENLPRGKCGQWRPWSICTYVQTDHGLHCPLINLHKCADWSWPSLSTDQSTQMCRLIMAFTVHWSIYTNVQTDHGLYCPLINLHKCADWSWPSLSTDQSTQMCRLIMAFTVHWSIYTNVQTDHGLHCPLQNNWIKRLIILLKGGKCHLLASWLQQWLALMCLHNPCCKLRSSDYYMISYFITFTVFF